MTIAKNHIHFDKESLLQANQKYVYSQIVYHHQCKLEKGIPNIVEMKMYKNWGTL